MSLISQTNFEQVFVAYVLTHLLFAHIHLLAIANLLLPIEEKHNSHIKIFYRKIKPMILII